MREASLQEVLEASFDHQVGGIYTAIPGIVVTVRDNFSNLTIDAQPAINMKGVDGTIAERPVVQNIPVQMPASSTSAITFPVNVGDSVLLVYSMRGLDVWKRGTGRQGVPSDNRKFDERDCFAIPGVFPIGNSVNNPSRHIWPHNPQDMVVVNRLSTGEETEIRLPQSGGVYISTNQDVAVDCRNATVLADTSATITTPSLTVNAEESVWTGNITHAGNYTMTGTASFNGVIFNTHIHGSSPPPSNP